MTTHQMDTQKAPSSTQDLDQNFLATSDMDALEKAAESDQAMVPPPKTDIYGSFLIDNAEFAIPVSAVQEVVNEPDTISPMPLSPPHILGLFNLRGLIIPIIDLRLLLEYPEREATSIRKVAILEHGDQYIGLLFDKTGEVLNGQGMMRVDFCANDNGIKDIVIEGVLKLDDGKRLVQILDPYELLNLEKIPRQSKRAEFEKSHIGRGIRRTCISFQTGHAQCAIDLRHVKEVKMLPEINQSLFTHGHFIGTVDLRGVILPVMDFRGFLGDESSFQFGKTLPKGRKMLVYETSEGPVGLMVFSIDSILTYYEEEILPVAKLALPQGDFVTGCLVDENSKIVMMIDQEKLSNFPSLVEAAKSCQEVFPPEVDIEDAKVKKVKNARRTFIQFSFERTFALDTRSVCEVINLPEEILQPPFSLPFVEGIINLRGELITLLNLGKIYGFSSTKVDDQKVLIFKHGEQKFGMLVDSVDEIIMTTDNNLTQFESGQADTKNRFLSEDVKGCLQNTLADGSVAVVMILDSKALVDRCDTSSK